jgi:uncharacterized membrane protein YuzA (DUF378 family)
VNKIVATFIALAGITLGLAIPWGIMGFLVFDWNFAHWNGFARFFYVIFAFFGVLVCGTFGACFGLAYHEQAEDRRALRQIRRTVAATKRVLK